MAFDPQPQSPAQWEQPPRPSFSSRLLRALGELLQTLLIAGALFVAVNLITARIRVEGNSMEPSLHDGQFVVVNRLAYQFEEPSRGDIVVFYFPLDTERRFIKRVVGEPGDRVQISNGQVFVNGDQIEEPYIAAAPSYAGDWQVGQSQVFVLGDNRNNSEDSQNWGMLPMGEVIGKAVLVYWPPADIGLIPHYDLATAAGN